MMRNNYNGKFNEYLNKTYERIFILKNVGEDTINIDYIYIDAL